MNDAWVLADRETGLDLGAFLRRAARLDPDGVTRFIAVGQVAAIYVSALNGGGLPTVLGLRTLTLGEPSTVDAVVPIAALLDRLAREENDLRVPVPPQQVSAPWAGLLPPRAGWQPSGGVAIDQLSQAARAGIAEIANGTPTGAGSAAVARLRAGVWGRVIEGTDVPAGVAFAADGLGFLRGDNGDNEALIAVNQRWSRLTTPGGFVLWRQPLLGS